MPEYSVFLRNRNFLLYNIGQVFSQLADRLIHITLIGIVYKMWPGSTQKLANVLFFTVAPAFIMSPVAGVYVDRLNKKSVLIGADLLRSIAVICMAFIIFSNAGFIPVCAAVFFIFACACFFLPAKLAIIPELVGPDTYLMANSVSTMLWAISGMLGFTSGAFIIEYIGIYKGLVLTAVIYLLSATVVSLIVYHGKKSGAPKVKEIIKAAPKSFLQDLKDGLLYLIRDKKALFVVGVFVIAMSLSGAIYVVGVVFIQDYTDSMTASLGILGLFMAIGFMIGMFFFGKLGGRIRKSTAIFTSFVAGGALIILFEETLRRTGSMALSCAVIFFLGIAVSPIMISGNTLIHEAIDEKMHGRVFSSIGVFMNAGFILLMFAGSKAAVIFGNGAVISACGVILLMTGISGYAVSFRYLKR